MTERSDHASVGVAFIGLCCVGGALSWGLPGPIALLLVGAIFILLGIGLKHLAGILWNGVAGYEDLQAPPEVTTENDVL